MFGGVTLVSLITGSATGGLKESDRKKVTGQQT